MNALPDEADVVIVGAGPVGLAMGIALAHYGVEAVIVDAAEERSAHSKAAVVHSRTLEVLRDFGADGELVDRGAIVPNFAFRDRDRSLLVTDFAKLPTAYPYTLMVPQDVTETVLDKRLHDLGGTVLRPWRVTELEQDDVSATVRVVDAEGAEKSVRARYVIGADGAHSAVRHLIGAEFVGSAYAQSFFLADVRMDWALTREEVQLFFAPMGLVVVAPLPEGLHRIVATVSEPIEAAGVGDVQKLLDDRGPRRQPAKVRELTWASNFRVSHRVADRYRVGRVFLTGDAAHVHSPAGGQGMNTGIQDAVNLAWKLALVCAGNADPKLLDTYEDERRAIALEVVSQTHRLTRLATMRGRARRTVRNALLGVVGSIPAVQNEMTHRLSELAVTYAHGRGRDRPGDRAAAELPPLPPGVPMFRLALPKNTSPDQEAEIRRAAEQASAQVLVYLADGVTSAQLVRPDGHLTAAGPVDQAAELLAHLPAGAVV